MRTKTTAQSRAHSEVTDSRDLRHLAEQIRAHIHKDCEDPRLRELASQIIKRYNVPARKPRQLARAFQLYAQNSIKFFREFPEINAAPWVTAKWGIGDCDDKARLIAALLKSFRIPVRLNYVTFNSGKRTVSHVYPSFCFLSATRSSDKQKWVALESVRPWPMGKSVLEQIKQRGWPYRIFSMII